MLIERLIERKKEDIGTIVAKRKNEYRYSFCIDFLDDAYPYGERAYEGLELHVDVYDRYCYVRNRFYRLRTHGAETQHIAGPDFADCFLAYLKEHGIVSYKDADLSPDYMDGNHLYIQCNKAGEELTVKAGKLLTEEFKNVRAELISLLGESISHAPSGWEYDESGDMLGKKKSYELKVEEGHLYLDVISLAGRHAKEEILRKEKFPELLAEVWKLWDSAKADEYDSLPKKALQALDAPVATYRMTYGSVLSMHSFDSTQEIPEEGRAMVKSIFELIGSPEYQK